MQDGEYGSKSISSTMGGCAMNTSRAANFLFNSLPSGPMPHKIMTLGSIGDDEAGELVQKQLEEEDLLHDVHIEEGALTG